MSRGGAYACAVLILIGILGLDYFALTSSAALTHIAERELKAVFGDRLEYAKVTLSMWGGLELRGAGLFVTNRRFKVLSADRLHVAIGRRNGSFVPETLTLERARLTFSDKLLDAMAEEPAKGSIDEAVKPEQLPRVVLRGGALEAAYAGILDVHSPQIFEIDEIQMVPVVGYRYFLGGKVRSALLGEWGVSGDVDLKSGAHDITLATEDLVVGPKIRSILSPKIRGVWDRFSPAGPIRARIDISRRAGGEMKVVATVQPMGVSLCHSEFPLPMADVRGEIEFRSDGFTVKHITARAAEARVWFDGAAAGYDADAAYNFRVEMRSLALDEALKRALQPGAQRVWTDFSPRGTIDVIGVLKREQGPDKPVLNPLDLTFKSVSFRFAGFPYDVENATGEIHIESPFVHVKYLDGRHLNGKLSNGQDDWGRVHMSGTLDDVETDPVIDLRMRGSNVALDVRLRQALPARMQQHWDDFDPSGAVDFEWHLTKAQGEIEEHRGVVRAQGNRIVYRHTPVPVRDITGEVKIEPGNIGLHNLSGALDHGRVACNGAVKDGPTGTEIHLKFDVDGGVIDDRFKSQMPSAISKVLTGLKLGGKADYRFKIDMIDDPVKPRNEYSLLLNMSEGIIDSKVRVDEIEGNVYLSGAIVDGQPDAFFGLNFRTARIVGKKVTDLTARGFVHGTEVTFQRMRAGAYGGTADGTLWFDMETTDLRGEFSIDRAELRDFVRDTKKFSNRNLSGKVHLDISVAGKGSNPESLTGGGSLLITDGSLLEVPGIVSFMAGGWAGNFTAARGDFVIRNGRFYVEEKHVLAFEAKSGAVYGQGWLDFDTRYSFKVTSETAPLFGIDFFLFKIPSAIFDLAKAPFKKRVRGRLDSDEVETITDPSKFEKDE